MVAQRSVIAAVVLTCVGALPLFLPGAMAPLIAEDLGFDAERIGVSVALFFLVSAVLSSWSGLVVERLGARRSGSIAAGISAASLLGIGVLATDWLTLTLFVAAGGIANAMGQLASNLLIARGVPAGRFGLAFGIKQSALPAATLLGGLSVPFIALSVGWRWAFVLGAALTVLWFLSAPPDQLATPKARPAAAAGLDRRTLIPLALAAGLGAAAANTLGPFFVASSVEAGHSIAVAGTLLAAGGALSIAARVTFGVIADRRPGREFRTAALMMLAGAIGGLLLVPMQPALVVLAVPVVFALGWGWNGLMNLAVVRRYPASPAAATGVTQAGLYAGGVVGPALFAALVTFGSYPLAWVAFAIAIFGAGIIVIAATGRAVQPASTLVAPSRGD